MTLGLDLTGAQEQGVALPDGTYTVIVDEAEVKTTSNGIGQYIKVKFRVTDGPHSGRPIWEQFNIKNQNAQAVQIGLGQLKGFMRAFGYPNPNRLESTAELLGLKGTVKTKQKTDDYGTKAEIKGYGAAAQGQAAPIAGGVTPPAQGSNPF